MEASRDRMVREEHTRRALEIEVRPRYLVPDTNCFIDHLPSIRALLQAKRFMLVVPLIGMYLLTGIIVYGKGCFF